MPQAGAIIRCIEAPCRSTYSIADKATRCRCGGLLALEYPDLELVPSTIKEIFRQRRTSRDPLDSSGVWRYREFLPFCDPSSTVTLEEGNTPVLEAPRCARYTGLDSLKVKHLGWNPTGSFKDCGMTVAVSQSRRLGATVLGCASTGNTSASMAAYCARSGQRAVVFVPRGRIAPGKLSQALDCGAQTVQIEGDFDAAMKMVESLARETDLYLVNSINPFRLEGQKTIIIELLDQLDWQVPDHLVVPGGNLGNCSAFGKALDELLQLGFIERIPSLVVVQAEGADPLRRTLDEGGERLAAVAAPETLATAIRIGNPVNWKRALAALKLSGGRCLTVSEQEIADAKATLGRDGLGCEPASAVTVAGLRKLVEQTAVAADASVVALLTGHQLKDPEYTARYHCDELETPGGRRLRSSLANRPAVVEADKEKIRKLIGL